MANRHEYKIGKFLLDTLTSGMYENPLCVYREYIQNSADAIDEAVKTTGASRDKFDIAIDIDPAAKRVVIRDNAFGVASDRVKRALLSVGDSDKFGVKQRGFRGIGRLGGVAYSSLVRFRTKARGSSVEHVCVWDSREIRHLLSPTNLGARDLTLEDLIERCVSFGEGQTSSTVDKAYFIVEMEGVRCSRDVLLDIREVRNYLSQVAPVPFDALAFPFATALDDEITRRVPNYNTYRVLLNGEEVHKPYSQTIVVRKAETDRILRVQHFEVCDRDNHCIAFGWRGVRDVNLAQIVGQTGIEGIRVRMGNIMIGTRHLLDSCFQEARFNRYNVGEIHVTDGDLLPNARRDDFEDSEIKTDFYNSITRILGGPLTKEIRVVSKKHAEMKPIAAAQESVAAIQKQLSRGFHTTRQKDDAFKDLRKTGDELQRMLNKRSIESDTRKDAEKASQLVQATLRQIDDGSMSIEDALKGKFSKEERELIQRVLDEVYSHYPKVTTPEKLIERVIGALKRG
jgi:molecular chaperone HtpG